MPPSERKPRPSSFPKRCGCGRAHDADAWQDLEFCGVMLGVEDIPDLELRHCPCVSTIAVALQ